MLRILESPSFYRQSVFRSRELTRRVKLFSEHEGLPSSQLPQYFLKRLLLFLDLSTGWRHTLAFHRESGVQENHVFGLYAPEVYRWMHRPTLEEAAHFAIESNPSSTHPLLRGQRPFGCHFWERYDRAFWVQTTPEELGHPNTLKLPC